MKTYAEATPGLPDLPSDFWTAFPGNSGMPSPWTPIGAAQTIASLRPERPPCWDGIGRRRCPLRPTPACSWSPPASRILPTVKALVLDSLVTQNRQVGLKNLHIIDALSSRS